MEQNFQTGMFINYLNMKTNYAVILYGNYGIGKTYFYKKILSPKIEETDVLGGKGEKYKPIHISLFGVKSVEDIEVAIIGELYPLMKANNRRLATSVGKTLLRGFFKLGQLGDIDKYLEDFKAIDVEKQIAERLSYKELVLCFDDLDRKHVDFNIGELLGFINSLVENEEAKIILIANEEELKGEQDYSKIVEKVVGITMQYKQNVKLVCKNIITELYKENYVSYFEYLKGNAELIVFFIELNKGNLRNLLFCIESYKSVFDSIEQFFNKNKEYLIAKNEIMDAVFRFSLAIMIELKLGLLTLEKAESIIGKNYELDRVLKIIKKTEKVEESDYIEKFGEKYFSDTKLFRFPSIMCIIFGLFDFNQKDFKQEITQHFTDLIEKDKEEYKVLNKLKYYECLNLDDKQYEEYTESMLKYVEEGKYELLDYPLLFEYSVRFNNILNYSFDTLIDRFKKGLEKGKSNFRAVEDYIWEIKHGVRYSEFPEEMEKILSICTSVNNAIFCKQSKIEKEEVYQLFLKDFDKYMEEVSAINSKWNIMPYFDYFSNEKMFNRLVNLNNSDVWVFISYIERRMSVINRQSNLKDEKIFFNEFSSYILDRKNNNEISKIKRFVLGKLHKVL
ncbi:P-loop NTPase fold protein [Myroides sp. N17-2]|uniref:P-loop NTPase fold protein n=1 Tax=Myroides sp. N17-2 TaxID=2030799 RepID=UPI000EFDAA51|nr:P-loop NTPase fold protein [Myroides sp. N17-2]